MYTLLRTLATGTLLMSSLNSGHALTVDHFSSPIAAGESTNASLKADPFEQFGTESLVFLASTAMFTVFSVAVNPFDWSANNGSDNEIEISYSINNGTRFEMLTTGIGVTNDLGVGAGKLELTLSEAATVSFFVEGLAGRSGNQVTFAAETSPLNSNNSVIVTPLLPSSLLLVSGVGLLAIGRKRKL